MMSKINFEIPSYGDIEEEQSKEILKQTGFDMRLFKEVVDLQNSLNEKVDIAWIQRKHDWNLAMLLESGELLDSFDWKWWKAGKNDWENVEIELIDLFHFLIAKAIEEKQTNIFSYLLMSAHIANKDKTDVIKNDELISNIQNIMITRFLPAILSKNTVGAIMAWIDLWFGMGRTADELFLTYKMKYALNIFRQDNGYKTGEYSKLWNGVEDNVIAQQLIEKHSIKNDSKFIKKLTDLLEEEYSKIERPKEKSLENFLESDPKWKYFIDLVPEESKKVIIDLAEEFKKYLEK